MDCPIPGHPKGGRVLRFLVRAGKGKIGTGRGWPLILVLNIGPGVPEAPRISPGDSRRLQQQPGEASRTKERLRNEAAQFQKNRNFNIQHVPGRMKKRRRERRKGRKRGR
jgi:hypothetical protein